MKHKLAFLAPILLSFFSYGTLHGENDSCSDDQHASIQDCAGERGGKAIHPSRSSPKFVDGRFYMKNKSFSILVPDRHRDSQIDEDNYFPLPLSVVLFTDHLGNLIQVSALQTKLCLPIDKCIEVSQSAFHDYVEPRVQRQVPGTRTIHEAKWSDQKDVGYFGVMAVPGGLKTLNFSGEEENINIMRGYLTSFIDGAVITITVQDRLFTFNEDDEFLLLEYLKRELLKQAVQMLKSYRSERGVSPMSSN